MGSELPFDIVFSPDYDSEIKVLSFAAGKVKEIPYYSFDFHGVNISVHSVEKDEWNVKIYNSAKAAVCGFWGVRFPWKHADDCFTFIPGIYYNGNVQSDINNIPCLKLPESPMFSASFSAAAFPAVMVKEGNKGYSYVISHKTEAGWNGVHLDAQNQNLTFYAPAKEQKIYRHKGFDQRARMPYILQPKGCIFLRISRNEFPCGEITDLFDYYWERTIRSKHYPSYNTPKVSEQECHEAVRDWFFNRHCIINHKKEPMILNAFTDLEGSWPYKNVSVGWNTLIGWCSGSMSALPLLKCGGRYREFAVSYLDFLSSNGNSPSGVKYPVYDGNVWLTKEHPDYKSTLYAHCRLYSDYIYYLGRAIRFEKENGFTHEKWEEDFLNGINIILKIWEKEKDFGTYWDIDKEDVLVDAKLSGAGVFPLLALGEGIFHFPHNEKLKAAFKEACNIYYNRCVVTGRCNAGPADIKLADDSESIAALTNSLLIQYKLFPNETNLNALVDSAKLFSTWVMHYVPPFPIGSPFENINVCGGVLANVQNRHIGPGICTNSAKFLYEIGEITGDERWKKLYSLIKTAAINCAAMYDGEFYDITPDKPFYKGMLSEQINVSDALNLSGVSWRVSACWPATFVLLNWFDEV